MLTRFAIFLIILVLLAGCDSPTDTPAEVEESPIPRDVSDADYVELDGGLKYYDFKIGTGDVAQNGNFVSVHYTGWLTDNTLFDSSYPRSQPIEFELGSGRVIMGWEIGLVGMQAGGERQLVIPAALAYGSSGQGPIPPNATLIFEVQLVSIQ